MRGRGRGGEGGREGGRGREDEGGRVREKEGWRDGGKAREGRREIGYISQTHLPLNT